MHRQIKITATGSYLPQKIVTSCFLDEKLGKPTGWVEAKSGVIKRHVASSHETTSYMATQAAQQALQQANLKPNQLSCIISACAIPEQAIPSTATLIQKTLGLGQSGIPAFDINSTCLSFLSALDVASYMIAANRFKHVLIVASDIASVGLNWQVLESSTIFGDGAAAAIVSQPTNNKLTTIINSLFETYGSGSHYCEIKAGGTRINPSTTTGDLTRHSQFQMDGKGVYKFTAQKMRGFIERLASRTGLTLNDIDIVIPHQASKLSMQHMIKHLGIQQEKIIDIFANHGNQVAASIPTALHHALKNGLIKPGKRILIIGTGAGISIGGTLLEYDQ